MLAQNVLFTCSCTIHHNTNAKSCSMERNTPWIPQIGMTFSSAEEVGMFWVFYGGQIGFNVRKKYENRSDLDNVITSSRFVCSSQGYRAKDKRDHLTKVPRAETRTGCNVHMGIMLDRDSGHYILHDLVTEHNHMLQLPETTHLMPSQRKISKAQATDIDMADDSGIKPKEAHELASRYVGGISNLSYTCRDHRNYLRTKRQRELKYGEAASILRYFQNKIAENPSFQYALQLDVEEQITNIFWADAKMVIDYAHFGDVVTFDTTFGTNKDYRPFGVFVGFNQFRETTIFGAALMYDETCDSFRWLFSTFLAAHNHKEPRTIFTDQDVAMGKAIAELFLNTWHGLCTWHISQNAVKHLNKQKIVSKKKAEGKQKIVSKKKTEGKQKVTCKDKTEDTCILADFSACMYEHEDISKFEEVFHTMRSKVQKETWLDSIYKLKEKLAECCMTNVFTLGMRSTQLSESFNSDLKCYLKVDLDVFRFFKHFERVVQEKRDKELESEYESRKKIPRLKMRTPMLLQASETYTPPIFEAFQGEYERSMATYARPSVNSDGYIVGMEALGKESTFEKEQTVTSNISEQTVSCSCRLFERIGILCAYALKVLDLMNIKQLPDHYILKRWTRAARNEIVEDSNGRRAIENPKLQASRRYKSMSHKFSCLASRVADNEECSMLVDNALNNLFKEVERKLKESHPAPIENDAREVSQLPEHLSHVAGLKKRDVQKTGSKRKKDWVQKMYKRNKTESTTITNISQLQENKENLMMQSETGPPERNHQVFQEKEFSQPLVETHSDINNQETEINGFPGYVQLLMGYSDGNELDSEGPCGNEDK
ncbi:hypothetical protein EJB05_40441 [Eragrostis curvula]|uniref:Zinc finger PMZ-type domain-containing protein n=1 Tax=Eragrostis curvula TaxID=38414 RepID=A0A5J9TR87_9POAL|nr:hypothetical protein EJB05_40441 [Eragrostis curvula]